jgi:hypothetical protein
MLCCFSCIAAIDSPYFLLLSIIVIRIVSSPIAYQFRFFPLEQVSGPSREVIQRGHLQETKFGKEWH